MGLLGRFHFVGRFLLLLLFYEYFVFEDELDLAEILLDGSNRVKLQVFLVGGKEGESSLFELGLLFVGLWFLVCALVDEEIMHLQFLLKLLEFFLEDLDLLALVLLDVDRDFVGDFGHAGCKSERRDCFFEVGSLRPDVGEHDSLGVAPDRVLQEICEFALPLRHVVPFFAETVNNLF